MAITRTPVTIGLHRDFLALAARLNLKPEFLAEIWCDELSLRNPEALTFSTARALEEMGAFVTPTVAQEESTPVVDGKEAA